MALDIVAAHASYFGDRDRAQVLAREERALAEQLGDPYHVAMAVMRQCWCAHGFVEARGFADEARPLLRRCGNLHGIVEMAAGLAGAALHEGEYEAAAELAEEGLRAAEEAGESFALSIALGNVGLAALFLERMDVAEARFREELEIQRRERIDGFWDEPVVGLGLHCRRRRRSRSAPRRSSAATRCCRCFPFPRATSEGVTCCSRGSSHRRVPHSVSMPGGAPPLRGPQ